MNLRHSRSIPACLVLLTIATCLSAPVVAEDYFGRRPIRKLSESVDINKPVDISAGTLKRVIPAAVQIVIARDEDNMSVGSGALLSKDGYVITNAHVIGDPQTRQGYSPTDCVLVSMSENSRRAAQPRYLAKVVNASYQLDIAVLKIVATADGKSLPKTMNLPHVSSGDSNRMEIGDEVTAIGFPGIGGDTVTVTQGIVAGFGTFEGSDEEWAKTDISISPGVSGGMVINSAGELIGVASGVIVDKTIGTKIGVFRPLHLALPGIEAAQATTSPGCLRATVGELAWVKQRIKRARYLSSTTLKRPMIDLQK